MKTIALKLFTWLIKNQRLTVGEMNILSTAILDSFSALPLCDIIKIDDRGSLTVNGRVLDLEQIHLLRESARGALNNQARKIINDQILYTAFVMAANKVQTPEQLIFSRAAIWWGQQERKLLLALTGEDGEVAPNEN